MLGLVGGTFDPIHYGHLRSALELFEALRLSELRFVPNAVPPHRAPAVANPVQRLEMVRRAIAGQPGFVLDDCELRRAGPSYTVDTVGALREQIGERPLCLLLGMDAFLGLHRWHEWAALPGLAHLVVAHRPGWSLDPREVAAPLRALLAEREAADAAALEAAPAGRVLLHPVTQLDISGTAIRELFRRGGSARYLMPDTVIDYIVEQGIYE